MPGVFLVGFMGSGKSTVGRCLAERLGYRFVDLDVVVEERAGESIREIFARHGEVEFRRLEADALSWAVALERVVVALGGGAFSTAANRRLVHGSGAVSVFLDLPWPALLERLPGDNADRPKFESPEAARRLLDERRPDYGRATMVVSLRGHETADDVANLIAARLAEVACAI